MITVVNRDTCKPAYIDPDCIQHIEEMSEDIDGRAYPFSRVFVSDKHQGHEYSLDVIESKRRIEQLSEIAREKRTAKAPRQSSCENS